MLEKKFSGKLELMLDNTPIKVKDLCQFKTNLINDLHRLYIESLTTKEPVLIRNEIDSLVKKYGMPSQDLDENFKRYSSWLDNHPNYIIPVSLAPKVHSLNLSTYEYL
jgi:hypothetical protein